MQLYSFDIQPFHYVSKWVDRIHSIAGLTYQLWLCVQIWCVIASISHWQFNLQVQVNFKHQHHSPTDLSIYRGGVCYCSASSYVCSYYMFTFIGWGDRTLMMSNRWDCLLYFLDNCLYMWCVHSSYIFTQQLSLLIDLCGFFHSIV